MDILEAKINIGLFFIIIGMFRLFDTIRMLVTNGISAHFIILAVLNLVAGILLIAIAVIIRKADLKNIKIARNILIIFSLIVFIYTSLLLVWGYTKSYQMAIGTFFIYILLSSAMLYLFYRSLLKSQTRKKF